MPRTVLEIVQDASAQTGIERPALLFGSDSRTDQEVRACLIEAADKIVRAHDWQALLRLDTDTGDGTTTEFALPSDFLRMPKDGRIWSSRWEWPLQRVTPEDWLQLDIKAYNLVTGVYTIYGGNLVYKPALVTGETAKYWYVSRNKCADTGGTPKETFTADTDTFRLDDRLLELVFIWTFRQMKGFDYAEDLATAEVALARAISDDKGARIITQASRTGSRIPVAYPLTVTP